MLVDVIQGVLAGLLNAVPNMLAVLAASLLAVLAVSFFRGEATVFTNLYQVIIFVTGTLSPLLGIAGGIAIVIRAQRRREWAQRELGVLFTLVFFAIAYYYELFDIPQFTIVS
jgi:hypothetical protein